ncbi:venom carboxylesterase-6-like [Ostrinia furnacalis]|uniref:venom carboxylesterase-6-like n=1 Tax=Ostrinia furnacalis TaxID=93504 RepID=UPI00103A4B70|nr:venom carboxylesterase-6-like [Ostrinia furnacalis]
MDSTSLIITFILSLLKNVELLVVKVNEGLLLGALLPLSTGQGSYYSFKGIPYAEPPVGNLRFKDPRPVKPWIGIKEALLHGPVCIQFNRIINSYVPGSEDCLYLNVYTPDLTPAKPLPVMVFIHGGAFRSGSGNSLIYGPDFIVQKNVVLVTLNYRLDALGFLKLDTKDVPGNAGLKDQSLALKWVHDNIAAFGGDPELITLAGQSAGSASVTYHMLSPMSKGLFKRAIAMSGVPFCEWAVTYELRKRSFALGKLLGSNTTDPYEMLNFLQSQPALKIVNKFPIVIPEEIFWNFGLKMTAFQPAPEKDLGHKRFLVESPIETLKRGNITPVDLLLGHTSLEYLFQLPNINSSLVNYSLMRRLLIPREIILYGSPQLDFDAIADRIYDKYFGQSAIGYGTLYEFLQYFSQESFEYQIRRFLKYLSAVIKRYFYKFFIISDRNRYASLGEPYGIVGVSHSDDIEYIFDSRVAKGGFPVNVTSEIYRLINQTVTLFTNFVKYGNPTPDGSLGAVWPQYDETSKGYMKINSTLSADSNPDADAVAFWTSIFSEAGIELP